MITFAIILLCFLTFLFQDLWFLKNFALVSGALSTEPWRALTSMFLHADASHLLFNMLALFMFGTYLEGKVGSKWFALIYLVSGIAGAIGFELLNPPGEYAVGASGAIYGIIGALAILAPRLTVYVYFVPLPIWAASILYAFIELVGLGRLDNIAHSAHLLGLVGGFITAKLYSYYTVGDREWL
ncbi:MAG: rhomboid family intramembrane serine protease [Candidatus Bilamarchaeaceae archaeon]